ncbi:MAG: murein biosynthesis integral membrane protein MurJ, partial [Verrucomicrobiota bacterium]
NTASAAFNLGLLLFALHKKLKNLELTALRRSAVPLMMAALLSGGIAWFARFFWEKNIGYTTLLSKFGGVFVPMILATLVYFSVSLWMKVASAREIIHLLLEKLGRLHDKN